MTPIDVHICIYSNNSLPIIYFATSAPLGGNQLWPVTTGMETFSLFTEMKRDFRSIKAKIFNLCYVSIPYYYTVVPDNVKQRIQTIMCMCLCMHVSVIYYYLSPDLLGQAHVQKCM